MKIIGIMACAQNGVVGSKGAIPWHYPEDFKHFRNVIGASPVIMGRKTFEVIPKTILKERVTIVCSSTTTTFRHPHEGNGSEVAYMIGGAELANFFLEQKLLSEFILTKLHRSYQGDAILNIKAFDNWKSCVINETSDYCIYKLTPQ